jgi:murein DD-endopeptidase MepM/ murein hydrolase activator NlpD
MRLPIDMHWILVGLLGCSAAMNVALLMPKTNNDIEPIPEIAQELAVEEALQQVTPVEEPVAISQDWKVLQLKVHQSLSQTFTAAAPSYGAALSAVYSRLFMFDIDMRRDLQKGDTVEVVYKIGDDGIPDIAAARFHSKKKQKTFSAYRWKAPFDEFSSYWASDGTETAYQLKNSPIKDYEQITSLLKDRPTHKGMDFKAPVGVKTTSPKSGVVTRVNFGSYSVNGGCVEVKLSDGVMAKYLHLSEVKVKVGQNVSAGTVVGLVGNTGRSTAPHLHYQLDKGRKNIDPIDYHGIQRRSLPAGAMADFMRETAPYMSLFDQNSSVADM